MGLARRGASTGDAGLAEQAGCAAGDQASGPGADEVVRSCGTRAPGLVSRAPSPNRAAERWPIDPTSPCDRFIPTQREIRRKNSTSRTHGRGNIMGRETERPAGDLYDPAQSDARASAGRRSFLGGSGLAAI